MAQATFSVRMDETLKKQFDSLCSDFGMTASTAINVFARAVVRERKIPFEIASPETEVTREKSSAGFFALRAQAAKDFPQGMSLEEINEEIRKARYGEGGDGMICYAVFDTNVIVSALLSSHADAVTVQLMGRMLAGDVFPVYSNAIMQEYREVLGRKKFKFEPEMIRYILSAIEKYGILVEPASIDVILPDMKDLPFYEVVMDKRDDNAYLVTGNRKHFPVKPYIVTARQMLDILDGNA